MQNKENYPTIIVALATILNLAIVVYMSLGAYAVGMLHRQSLSIYGYISISIPIVVLVGYFILLSRFSKKFKECKITRKTFIYFLSASPFFIAFLSLSLCATIGFVSEKIM